jgi:hypothetical protein
MVRTAYSDEPGIWNELPEQGTDEVMCTIAPLNDTSALIVTAGESGLTWAMCSGDRWIEQGNLDPRSLGALHPRLRLRPSGGLWLMWTDRFWVHMSSYHDGEWFRGDSLNAVHALGQTFWSAWCDVSYDSAERPVLVWGDLGVGSTFRDVGCIAFPTDTGWTQGEEIPGSDGLFLTPTVAVDRNGDAWVSIDPRFSNGVLFTHTYAKATTSIPKILGSGPTRTVSWTLSEQAPGTWWAVLRAKPGQPFEEVARVQATKDLQVGWTDPGAPPGVVLYKVRRECVDVRYRWESAVGSWPPPRFGPYLPVRDPLTIAVGPRGLDLTTLVFSGAPEGQLKLELFDLQGRLVHRESLRATGSGRDTFELRPRAFAQALPPGIYFARAIDSLHRASNATKILILR